MKFIHLLPLSLAIAFVSCKSEAEKPGTPEAAAAAESPTESAAMPAGGYVLAKEESPRVAGSSRVVLEEMNMPAGKLAIESAQGTMEGVTQVKKSRRMKIENLSEDEARVEVIAAEESQSMTMGGNDLPPQTKEQTLVGVPLLVTRKDGVWSVAREDGQTATAAEEMELATILRNVEGKGGALVYGTETRKPGDTWTMDAKDAPWMGEAADSEGKLHLSFEKVAEHDGMECAFLSGTFDVTGKPPETMPGMEGEMKMSGKVSVIRSLEHLQDLSVEMEGVMEMEMTMPGGTMSLDGPLTMVITSDISK